MIIGVLAILKAGGAYVPLDPAYASERLQDILTDISPSIVIADKSGQKVLGDELLMSVSVVDPNAEDIYSILNSNNNQLANSTSNPQVPGLTSHHLAYVIYTSGSTGKPKGVMVEHQ
ncbi:hypothetical protein BGZ65_001219, partial [Modicella reniformis]